MKSPALYIGLILVLLTLANAAPLADENQSDGDSWSEITSALQDNTGVQTTNGFPTNLVMMTWNTDGETYSAVDWPNALAKAGIDFSKYKDAGTAPLVAVMVQEATEGTIKSSGGKTLSLHAIMKNAGFVMLAEGRIRGYSGSNSVFKKKVKVTVFQHKDGPWVAKNSECKTANCPVKAGTPAAEASFSTFCDPGKFGLGVGKTEKGSASVKVCHGKDGQCLVLGSVHLPDKPAGYRRGCLQQVVDEIVPSIGSKDTYFLVGDFNARIFVTAAQLKQLNVYDKIKKKWHSWISGAADVGVDKSKTTLPEVMTHLPPNWMRIQDSNFHSSTDQAVGESLSTVLAQLPSAKTKGIQLKYRLPSPTYKIKFKELKSSTSGPPLSPDLEGVAGGYNECPHNKPEMCELGFKEKKQLVANGNFFDSIAYLDQMAASKAAFDAYPNIGVGVFAAANTGIQDHAFTVWEGTSAKGTFVCTKCAKAQSTDVTPAMASVAKQDEKKAPSTESYKEILDANPPIKKKEALVQTDTSDEEQLEEEEEQWHEDDKEEEEEEEEEDDDEQDE